MAMVQYGLWGNCCNACEFCLRKDRRSLPNSGLIIELESVRENLDYIDWEDEFGHGISLLGGELYFITDQKVQEAYMRLVDDIIDKVLLVSKNPAVRYSTVTNGLYEPSFLFRVIDRIVERAGIDKVDVNFSFDLKYRFATEERKQLCLDNINAFTKRYNYKTGVQMILTQYVIDMVKDGTFNIREFCEKEIPGGNLCFLYPHKIHGGIKLPDFEFKRRDLLDFVMWLKTEDVGVYKSFIESTRNSQSFKYTGFNVKRGDPKQQPMLTDGKESINPMCGHSTLYQCYADSDACLLCDLEDLR